MSPGSSEAILQTRLPGLTLVASGKVRDVFRLDERTLLFVATDRLSAFDVVFPDPIPRKGEVLTALSVFWFGKLSHLISSHYIGSRIDVFSSTLNNYRPQLEGRSMLVRAAEMIPIECVVRGYLAGSGWKDYQATGRVCGIGLPAGLRDGDRLPEPIFTPASKSHSGHDENISFDQAAGLIGEDLATQLRQVSLDIYDTAAEYAKSRGILLADTKFEFGWIDGQLALCDEALTPDSSRFWSADLWRPGGPQPSFDKQFVRDYLESINWNKMPPAPHLPPNVIAQTTVKYLEAYRLLTDQAL